MSISTATRVEYATEAALKSAIDTDLPELDYVLASEGTATLTVPRLELIAQRVSEGPHLKFITSVSKWLPDQWEVLVSIRLIQLPDSDGDTPGLIEQAIWAEFVGNTALHLTTHDLADFQLGPRNRSIVDEESAVLTEWSARATLFAKAATWSA